jgi:hypothetical protein
MSSTIVPPPGEVDRERKTDPPNSKSDFPSAEVQVLAADHGRRLIGIEARLGAIEECQREFGVLMTDVHVKQSDMPELVANSVANKVLQMYQELILELKNRIEALEDANALEPNGAIHD